MKKIVTLIAVLALKNTAFAQTVNQEAPKLENGTYYALSPELAARLNIDYNALIQALRLREDQGIVVKKDVGQENVDISIFDSHQFAQARMDFVRQ
ncbi:MAG: hypothetical protein KF789_07510 [Bdellovibrionaceae bacterium]|nr:hypothetical protein [Pseudobdellovibrionaceae bacterium]